MPRTSNPNDEIEAFEAKVDASLDLWARTQDALRLADLALRKTVSLDAFLRVAVAWEGFRSDWHLAAINRNTAAYRADLERRFGEHVRSTRFANIEPFVQVVIPRQLDLARVRDLLDPLGRNISFGDHWADTARHQLVPRFALKVTSLPPADFRLVSACEKLRNAIVHRSAASVAEMNDALLVLDPPPTPTSCDQAG